MKRKIMLLCAMFLIAIVLTGCSTSSEKGIDQLPYSIKPGGYLFENAAITNISTKEVTEKVFDDILGDENWNWMFSFSVGVKEDTKFVYHSDTDSYYVLNGGLAFKLIADDTLELYIPRFQGYDYGIYEIRITLISHKRY